MAPVEPAENRSDGAAAAVGVELTSISVTFPGQRPVLDGLSLEIEGGQITSVLGPSGCGKSTLLRVIAGLQPPSSGRLAFRDDEGSAAGSRSSLAAGELAYVFQDAALLPWRDVLANVSLPMELLGRYRASDRRQRAAEHLREVDLGPSQWHKLPSQLSGGMRMRVSLARALVTEPAVLLLDEPFAALDDMLRERLGQLVVDLWNRHRRTIILVTHNIAEAVLLSQRVVVLGQGHVAAQIPVDLDRTSIAETRRQAAFHELYGQVSDALRESQA